MPMTNQERLSACGYVTEIAVIPAPFKEAGYNRKRTIEALNHWCLYKLDEDYLVKDTRPVAWSKDVAYFNIITITKEDRDVVRDYFT